MINHSRDYITDDHPDLVGESLERYGMCIGDGWVPLVNTLTDNLIEITKSFNETHPDCDVGFIIFGVKEKFGGLRYYIEYTGLPDNYWKFPRIVNNEYTDYIRMTGDVVRSFEKTSYFICETCGRFGELTRTNGWMYTACEDHIKEGD